MFPGDPLRRDPLPPISSFAQPTIYPDTDPDSGPQVCIQFGVDWLPLVIGCLLQLLEDTSPDVLTDDDRLLAQQRANQLIYLFQLQLACGGGNPLSGMDVEDFMPIRVDCNCRVYVTCCDGTEVELATIKDLKAGTTQPGAGAAQPTVGGPAVCYDMSLRADGVWLVPTPLSTGDTIQLTNLQGAGNDGSESVWHCPDGELYFLGACVGGASTSGTDPIPASPHMSIIVKIGSSYYPVYSGATFTVPSGHTGDTATIQVNDSVLAGNQGSYNASVCVQRSNPVATVHLTYSIGSGPATANSGDIIAVMTGANSGPWWSQAVTVNIDPCHELDYVSNVGMTFGGSGDTEASGNFVDCSAANHFTYHDYYNIPQASSSVNFNSTTPGTVYFRVV